MASRKVKLAVGLTGAIGLALAGCGAPPSNVTADPNDSEQYAELCIDQETKERVPEEKCEDNDGNHSGHSHGSSPFIWYWLGTQAGNNTYNSGGYTSSSKLPGVGEKVAGGSSTKPSSGVIYQNLPQEKGKSFSEAYSSNRSTAMDPKSNKSLTKSEATDKVKSEAQTRAETKAKTDSKSKSGSNSDSKSKSGSNSNSGKSGGLGGGSKSGGGTSGG